MSLRYECIHYIREIVSIKFVQFYVDSSYCVLLFYQYMFVQFLVKYLTVIMKALEYTTVFVSLTVKLFLYVKQFFCIVTCFFDTFFAQ